MLFSSRHFLAAGFIGVLLVGCGGDSGRNDSLSNSGAIPAAVITDSSPRFAEGPIATACNIHNRNRATKSQCGCIQAAANMTLSKSQQQRSVRFFAEPDLLQTIKASDTPENERFWYAWDGFAETAEALCK